MAGKKKRIEELINSCITLTTKERREVEHYIWSRSSQVKPEHLAHYQCLAAVRGKGVCKGN